MDLVPKSGRSLKLMIISSFQSYPLAITYQFEALDECEIPGWKPLLCCAQEEPWEEVLGVTGQLCTVGPWGWPALGALQQPAGGPGTQEGSWGSAGAHEQNQPHPPQHTHMCACVTTLLASGVPLSTWLLATGRAVTITRHPSFA